MPAATAEPAKLLNHGDPLRLRRGCGGALFAALLLLAMPSCQAPPAPHAVEVRPKGSPARPPTVRVRIVPNSASVELSSRQDLVVKPAGLEAPRRILRSPITLRPTDDGILVTTARQGQRWTSHVLQVTATHQSPIRCRGTDYEGALLVHLRESSPRGRLDVVNHLPMEHYLPGVLDRELYRHWHPSAFRAQAIAARSYALHTMETRRRRHYDVESTTADQAYGGMTSNAKALKAVAATRGQILTYAGQVLPAYYSSACGGIGQDAAAAFPRGLDIPPLHGRRHGHWCRKSSYFRWGPVIRDKSHFERRLRAWARDRRHALRTLQTIVSLKVVKRNRAGRAAKVAILDSAGRTFPLSAESMRLAANFETPGLEPLDPKSRLPSAEASISVTASRIRFQGGQGFGHGVGMCQFGSQAQAVAGHDPHTILGYYYPGATIKQAY